MFTRTSVVVLLTALFICSWARGQGQPTQLIQLPTFSFFTVSTTVSVPVSGRGFIGGVQRRSSRSSSRGLPWMSNLPAASRLARSRALSVESTSKAAAVSATVMDLKKMDDAVLSVAAARRGSSALRISNTDARALRISRDGGYNAEQANLRLRSSSLSVAEIRRRNALADSELAAELIRSWKQARAAESAGRMGAARCGYQIVARRGKGKLREAALARLAVLSPQPKIARAD